MSNSNIYLRENLGEISKNIFISPSISEKKLNNAIKAFDFKGDSSTIIALYDNTLFGSGKEGILFTGERLIYREFLESPISITFSSIESVDFVKTVIEGKDGKKDKFKESIVITQKNDSKKTITGLVECDYPKLAEVLKTCIQEFTEFNEEKQMLPIDELSDSLKVAYVQAIINMAYDNDDIIDDKECSEILQLMTRLDLNSDARFELRSYMLSSENQVPLSDLLECIEKHSPVGQVNELYLSLVKDMINLYYVIGVRDEEKFVFIQKNRDLLKVNDKEIDLALSTIKNDYAMLEDDLTDDQIISSIKLLSAKAAAVGTPLAAVYLSGSVAGMSAAGLTSGLASLGMGGLLGMSSMVTGIGVVVLIGVGAYTGVRKLTGASELSRFKQREMMLNEVIKQTQLTISSVMKDVNFIIIKLNEQIQLHGAQDAKVKELAEIVLKLTKAGTKLTEKTESIQATAIRLRCPQYLNKQKLRSLTSDPLKVELYDFIMSYYEDCLVVKDEYDAEEGENKEKAEDTNNEVKLCLKDISDNKELEALEEAFKVIGYFNAKDVLASSASEAVNKAKNKFGNIFHDK